jgi:hypothetical protein
MFGLIRKKEVINQLGYIQSNITAWENIWKDAKEENVRLTVTHTLSCIKGLVDNTKEYFERGF